MGWVQSGILYLRFERDFAITKAECCQTHTHKTLHYSVIETAPWLLLIFLKIEEIGIFWLPLIFLKIEKIGFKYLLCSSSFFLILFPSFFLPFFLSSYSITHNSKTIGWIWTFYICNKCSAIGHLPFPDWAAWLELHASYDWRATAPNTHHGLFPIFHYMRIQVQLENHRLPATPLHTKRLHHYRRCFTSCWKRQSSCNLQATVLFKHRSLVVLCASMIDNDTQCGYDCIIIRDSVF